MYSCGRWKKHRPRRVIIGTPAKAEKNEPQEEKILLKAGIAFPKLIVRTFFIL